VKVIKLDKTEYKVSAIPSHLAVYTDYIGELTKKKPSNLEEVEKQSEEMKTCINKILAETVSPTPKPEHLLELYNHVIDETNEVLERAKFFRNPKQ